MHTPSIAPHRKCTRRGPPPPLPPQLMRRLVRPDTCSIPRTRDSSDRVARIGGLGGVANSIGHSQGDVVVSAARETSRERLRVDLQHGQANLRCQQWGGIQGGCQRSAQQRHGCCRTHPRDAAGADGGPSADGRGTEVELGEVCAVGCAAVSVIGPAPSAPSPA